MPALSFDLNLGSLLSPVLLVVLAYIVNVARKAVDKRVDERHAETTAHLNRIEELYKSTNTRVEAVEARQAAHEMQAQTDHDTLMRMVGQVESLIGRKGET